MVQQRRRLLRAALILLLLAAAAAVTSADETSHHQSDNVNRKTVNISRYGVSGSAAGSQQSVSISDIVQWRTITFDFEGNETREHEYRTSGRYDPSAIVLIDADVLGDRVYLTTPPFRRGTPASLSTVKLTSSQGVDPAVRPYGGWNAHATTRDALTDCARQMVSVFRMTRLPYDNTTIYLIDSGVVDIQSTFEKLCPPKIVMVDVIIGAVVHTTEIEGDCNSLYIAIQVERTSEGHRVAYTADVIGNYVAVTDLTTGQTHRVSSQYFYPTPGLGITNIGGVRSFLMDGIFTLALGNGNLYSSAFASKTLNKVSTEILRGASDGQILDLTTQTLVPGQRAGQSGTMAVDSPETRLFFGIAEQEALYCWNTHSPYEQRNFRLISQDRERLQFFSGMKVLHSNSTLLVVTDRFNKFAENRLDSQQANFRIMTVDIVNLTC